MHRGGEGDTVVSHGPEQPGSLLRPRIDRLPDPRLRRPRQRAARHLGGPGPGQVQGPRAQGRAPRRRRLLVVQRRREHAPGRPHRDRRSVLPRLRARGRQLRDHAARAASTPRPASPTWTSTASTSRCCTRASRCSAPRSTAPSRSSRWRASARTTSGSPSSVEGSDGRLDRPGDPAHHRRRRHRRGDEARARPRSQGRGDLRVPERRSRSRCPRTRRSGRSRKTPTPRSQCTSAASCRRPARAAAVPSNMNTPQFMGCRGSHEVGFAHAARREPAALLRRVREVLRREAAPRRVEHRLDPHDARADRRHVLPVPLLHQRRRHARHAEPHLPPQLLGVVHARHRRHGPPSPAEHRPDHVVDRLPAHRIRLAEQPRHDRAQLPRPPECGSEEDAARQLQTSLQARPVPETISYL